MSHAQIGAVSAPICAFYHRSLGGSSIVSVQPYPFQFHSGSKLGQEQGDSNFSGMVPQIFLAWWNGSCYYKSTIASMMLGADSFAKRKTVKRPGDPAEGAAGSGNAVPGKGLHENHHRRDRKGGGHRTELVLPCFSQ